MKISKQLQILHDVKALFGNNVNCDVEIAKLKSNLFECPNCHGSGIIYEKYNAYPSGLPDSGWAERWEYKEKECPLCKGEGYTRKEYRPHMVQKGWEEV